MQSSHRGAVARRFGMKESELVDVAESEHGTVATLADGSTLIDVDEDKPDAAGKTGIMFAVAPANYQGTFPVFTHALELDDDQTDDELDDDQTDDELDDEEPVPEGTIAEILAWVGEDADRAVASRDAELERDKPRSSLISELEWADQNG